MFPFSFIVSVYPARSYSHRVEVGYGCRRFRSACSLHFNPTLTLKMDAACASKTSETKPTSTCCKYPKYMFKIGLDDRGVGVWVPVGSRIFSSPRRSDRPWGPLSLLSNGYRGSFPGGKADHSPLPTSTEVKKMWIYTSTLKCAFMT
jgi:hypothetical protein